MDMEMYICTMEYYSAIKKKESLLFATTWMDFVKSVSEMSQIEKDKYYMISFIFGV